MPWTKHWGICLLESKFKIKWYEPLHCEHTELLQAVKYANAKFLEGTQKFYDGTQSFSRERKSFTTERKVSRGNANVLRQNAKFLEGTQKYCERMQSILKIFFPPFPNFFHSPQIVPTTMSLKGLRTKQTWKKLLSKSTL